MAEETLGISHTGHRVGKTPVVVLIVFVVVVEVEAGQPLGFKWVPTETAFFALLGVLNSELQK